MLARVSPTEPGDPAQLYERAAGGDGAAFDALLERYLPQLHAFVHVRLGPALRGRETSMDVVQSVCRQLLAARERFAFQGEDRFRGWLFTAALNKIRDKGRFHRLGVGAAAPARHAPAAPSVAAAYFLTPSREVAGKETGQALEDALAALSEEHREVITLARIAGLPHRVIAELMDRSDEAVRQLLGRALVRLARELRARGVEVADG